MQDLIFKQLGSPQPADVQAKAAAKWKAAPAPPGPVAGPLPAGLLGSPTSSDVIRCNLPGSPLAASSSLADAVAAALAPNHPPEPQFLPETGSTAANGSSPPTNLAPSNNFESAPPPPAKITAVDSEQQQAPRSSALGEAAPPPLEITQHTPTVEAPKSPPGLDMSVPENIMEPPCEPPPGLPLPSEMLSNLGADLELSNDILLNNALNLNDEEITKLLRYAFEQREWLRKAVAERMEHISTS